MKRILSKLAATALCALASLSSGRSESFSEPPLVIYGQVIQIGAGASYQLFSGNLTLTISNESDATHVITRTIPLRPVGDGGEYSYRMEVPLKYLPEARERPENLSVGHQATSYRLITFEIDGVPATPLDESLAELALNFADRAKLHRLDLKVSLTPADTDADGIPDWWEDQHGLNRHYAPDAAADTDGDGLSNLEEFRHNTDPDVSNFSPLVKTTRVLVVAGAQAGLSLLIVDQDTSPADLGLVALHAVEGLTWFRDGVALPDAQYFTYADVLEGRITLAAAPDFQGATVTMGLHDPLEPSPDKAFVLTVAVITPSDLRPAVWLHAGSLSFNGPMVEWPDGSSYRRDGYQPYVTSKPTAVAGQRAEFADGQFLYVDDRGLSLQSFTAFLTFDITGTDAADQTLVSSPELQLRLGGDASARAAQSLTLTRMGRILEGPPISAGLPHHIILGGNPDRSFLISPDQEYFTSTPAAAAPLSTFTTIGGLQRLSESTARDFLQGGVRELILFDRELSVVDRSRLEAYQMARWEGWLLWDNIEQILPVQIQGGTAHHNLILGGWGNDSLQGGPLADVITGGPGADLCFGGPGPDRFAFFPGSGDDVLGDFSAADGDVIDLTPIFATQTGSPDRYLHLRAVVTRGADNVPRVDSLLELNYAGDGGSPDQVLTLRGVSVGDSDLPRLVGEGSIRLGGPAFETTVWLTATRTNLSEAGGAYEVNVVRSGNLDAALAIPLSLTGTAQVDVDYQVDGAAGSGVVRTISLQRGQAEGTFRIVPIADPTMEEEYLEVQVLHAAALTGRPVNPLHLTLEDAAVLTIQTLQHLRTESTSPALVQINRAGNLNQSLDVHLGFAGDLARGVDYTTLPEPVIFQAGEIHKVLEIRPTAPRPFSSELETIGVTVEADTGTYVLGEPSHAEVLVLPGTAAPSYAAWRAQAPAGQDGLLAYLSDHSTDLDAASVQIRLGNGTLELWFTTVAGLTDVTLSVVSSTDLMHWQDVTSQFTPHLVWLEDGRVRYVFRANTQATDLQRYYQISAQAPSLE